MHSKFHTEPGNNTSETHNLIIPKHKLAQNAE